MQMFSTIHGKLKNSLTEQKRLAGLAEALGVSQLMFFLFKSALNFNQLEFQTNVCTSKRAIFQALIPFLKLDYVFCRFQP